MKSPAIQRGSVASGRAWPWLGALALWTAAFTLACVTLTHPAQAYHAAPSFWALALGSGRTAVAQTLYERAEVYFHDGVEDIATPAFTSLFQRWGEILAPQRHVHVSGASSLELMPWYRWTTQLDPQNVEAWLDAAYIAYTSGAAGPRADLADRILAEGLRANPRHFRLYLERGRLYLRRGEWARAAYALDLARRLFPETRPTDEIAARQALLDLLTMSSFAHEILGERDSAQAALRELLQLAPEQAVARTRLAALERGADTRSSAIAYLQRAMHSAHVCDREAALQPKGANGTTP